MAAKKDLLETDIDEFVPSRPSLRRANNPEKSVEHTTKRPAKMQHHRPGWACRHRWLILVVACVLCLLVIIGVVAKVRADTSAKNYRTNAARYLDNAANIVASSTAPHAAATQFNHLKVPKFVDVFFAENYSNEYKQALDDKKAVESIRGGIASKLTEYSMLADFEAAYQTELAKVAALHDEEPATIDDSADWVKHYQTEIAAMQKTVKDSQVPPEVQDAKTDLKTALDAAARALNDVASAVEVGRVDTYNAAFDKLTAAENNAAEAYDRIQTVEPQAAQAALLTDIANAKSKL